MISINFFLQISPQLPPSKMSMKPRAVSLSPGDNRKTFEQNYPRAHRAIQSHSDLFFKLTGIQAYKTPFPPETMSDLPKHLYGSPYGYVGKNGHSLDHTTFLTERSFVKSLSKEFQVFATLHHMCHAFFDLFDGPHDLTNDRRGSFDVIIICKKERMGRLKSSHD